MPDQTPTAYLDPHSPPPVVNGKPKEIADGVFVVLDGHVPLVLPGRCAQLKWKM
jgi:hypothetical protein